MELISSRQNPRVQALARLLREKQARTEAGRFVIEGARECARALAAGVKPHEYFICPALFREGDDTALLETLGHSEATGFELSQSAFEKASGRQGPDGFLMTTPLLECSLENLKQSKENPLFLVLENIEKPGNLGALLRSADAAGVDAVICCGQTIDIHNPNVVRNSQGALFSVKIACATNEEAAAFLEKHNALILQTTPAAEKLYWDAPMKNTCALLLGSEKDGLSDFWLNKTGTSIRIPMHGGADSLNVSVAAAIVLFEAVRQRG